MYAWAPCIRQQSTNIWTQGTHVFPSIDLNLYDRVIFILKGHYDQHHIFLTQHPFCREMGSLGVRCLCRRNSESNMNVGSFWSYSKAYFAFTGLRKAWLISPGPRKGCAGPHRVSMTGDSHPEPCGEALWSKTQVGSLRPPWNPALDTGLADSANGLGIADLRKTSLSLMKSRGQKEPICFSMSMPSGLITPPNSSLVPTSYFGFSLEHTSGHLRVSS